MKIQQTLVLIKPDGLVKSLTGNVITELSDTELTIVGAKVVQVTRELAEEHYQHLKEEKFFNELIKYIMGEYHVKRVLALVYHGENTIKNIRKVVGSTHPEKAEPTTIRGKYGRVTSKGVFENVVHASENEKEAEREIKLWFRPEELAYTIYPTDTKEVKKVEYFWKS
ncbi:MAG: nucleoside-diphosphate kinase [Candidatus Woesearchaeota archaeon]|jgi:nucleoside-diphosphate kinase|nr:nucleoside-diphosphate kinase [Candidatus Woesearchaeota archaeon]MDP6265602.1 nucleoside-diphosphate kinase [Candidatus Woesearchaeota archaeon]MDP7322607.1 nucleoside-diphosphate kinase [Candidatus Woesearchaeota archaeon]MDP7476807.1 nucleoside-diphosphate kinase [Candidatus Woesearchaeota archaeon]|tara:strand:+ start:65 stop:568 length:504 start_codon:yes stop_codon:yes gene_type:complete